MTSQSNNDNSTSETKYSLIGFSKTDLEILSSLKHFMSDHGLPYSMEYLSRYVLKDKERRSITILNEDAMMNICSFLCVHEGLMFMSLNKNMLAMQANIWKVYETVYFLGSEMPADPGLLKLNIAIDWFEDAKDYNEDLSRFLNRIHGTEKNLTKLIKRNENIDRMRGPTLLLQTVDEYLINKSEIKSLENALSSFYKDTTEEIRNCLEAFRWLCPYGLYCNMPDIDERLYVGIDARREKEYNDEMSDMYGSDWEEHDTHHHHV
jgi:hypothetical protein